MEVEKERKTGLSLKFFKNIWVVIGVFLAILVVTTAGILIALNKNGNDSGSALAAGADTIFEIKMGDDIISIPGTYKYKIEEDGSISLTDDASKWVANMVIRKDILYENFESRFDAIVESYKTNPGVAVVAGSGFLAVGEKEYFYIDVVGKEGSLTGSYIYTGIDDNILEIIIEDTEAEFRHDLLEKLALIIEGIRKNIRIEDSFADTVKSRVRVDIPTIIKEGEM